MKQLSLILLSLLGLQLKAQCPWTFSISSPNGYTVTCTNPSLALIASNTNTNSVTYAWSGPAFSSTQASVSITQAGNYSLVATDAVTTCSMLQTFAVNVNTAVPIHSVNPMYTLETCISGGTSYTGTAISPTTNIIQEWYNPILPYPGGTPVETSTNQISILPNAFISGIFQFVTRNTINGCVAVTSFTINNIVAYPTFSVVSSSNFTFDCQSTIVSFTNVVSTQTPPASCSFSFVPPTFTGSVQQVIILSPTPSLAISTPGTWTMIAQDNSNFCRTAVQVGVIQNGNPVTFNHTVMPGGFVNFQSTYTGTNIGTTYSWDFGDGTVGTGSATSHGYANGGIHNVVLTTSNPNCATGSLPIDVNSIPCAANSNFSLAYSGIPQTWLATPLYYGNVVNAEWNWGDGSSDLALYPSHTYSNAGNYNICLTVTVTCGSSSSNCAVYNIYRSAEVNPDMAMVTVSVVAAPPVGLKEYGTQALEFGVYPNPASELLNIQLDNYEEAKVEIYNVLGALVMEEKLATATNTLNISELLNGIYNLKITSKEGRVGVKRLVVAR